MLAPERGKSTMGKLRPRDLVEMMAERGLTMAHTTIMHWVQHYTPEFEKRWHRHAPARSLKAARLPPTCSPHSEG